MLPVSDVDRAKRFYEGLGWRLDADFVGDGWRAVQFTPPAPPAPSISTRDHEVRAGIRARTPFSWSRTSRWPAPNSPREAPR